ncbi:MAG: hypothetical protein A2Y21_10405 [Clostridiales bacterium GWC2_40_7]|nr:MAG: hypothetical protein A2Y21_10405 [Clostridiales bacterium GWC2_40_7]
MGISPEKALGDEMPLYQQVNNCANIDSIINWFENKLELCFASIRDKINEANKKVSEKAKEYILGLSGGITLEDAASYVHMSPTYFSRIFKQETGENFIDFLSSVKIEKAKELLKTKTNKINEICKLAGFNDVKHFSKVFKKHTCCTPNEYRDIWFKQN